MSVMFELVIPPAIEPFSLTDLKAALRIDHPLDDDLVMRLGVTARAFIERRLGHAVAEQTWRLVSQGQPSGPLAVRPGRVRSILSVSLFFGDQPGIASDDWRFLPGRPDLIEIEAPASAGGDPLSRIEVEFLSGRSDMSLTPPELVEAIFALTAHYYEHREAVAAGRYVAMPLRVETLLSGLREVQL